MKLFPAAAAALIAAAPAFASASDFLVDFEHQWEYGTAVDNTYAAQGVSFVNVLGLSNQAPDFVYYSGAPSPLGTAFAQTFGADDRAFMNVAAGVSNALTFFYSTPAAISGAISAYSGLNGTGMLLGTFSLIANDATSLYDTWTAANFAFKGTARSFDLTASANVVGFDNIAGVTPVPEPSTIALMLVGGAGMLRFAARRRRT